MPLSSDRPAGTGLAAQTAARIDTRVADCQAGARVPSISAGVFRNGLPVHLTGAGELPAPTPDMQYRIGSISKTLTASLVMQLRDSGALVLDDPLERYLPGIQVGRVTVRQLLGHVSGLQREPDGSWWERSVGADIPGLLAGVDADKLAGPPFAGYHYSNLAYGLLGAVLTRVTGTSWADLVAGRLLKPLGMHRTTYAPTEPFARGYVVHPWHQTLREEPRLDAGAMAPAGQLWSTVTDLGRWTGFLAGAAGPGSELVAPGHTILAPDTLAEMCLPVTISDLDSWTEGHGLGFELWRRGERVYVGHTGSMPGYLAVAMAHRPSGMSVVAFANAYSMRGDSIAGLGLDLLTEAVDGEPDRSRPWRPGAAPPPEVEPLTGRWWWMGREYEASYDPAAQELVIRSVSRPGAEPWRFTAEGTDRWRCHSGMNTGEILRVERARNGAVASLDIATFVFSRDPWPSL